MVTLGTPGELIGHGAKKAKVAATHGNYRLTTMAYTIPNFSPTGAKARLKRAKAPAPPHLLKSGLFSMAWVRQLWRGLWQLWRRLRQNPEQQRKSLQIQFFFKATSSPVSFSATRRRCFVPDDWRDGFGVERGILFLKERLASWN